MVDKKMNVLAIIRSVGERTTDFCKYLIQRQGVECVIVKNLSPVTKAIKEMYQIAIEKNKKWTLSVDADQLIRDEGIRYLFELAENQSENTYAVKGTVIDKLLLHLRGDGYGPILFRTEIFKRMINWIPNPNECMTPESYMMKKLNKEGMKYVRDKEFVALHDFEQYYEDIYRKCFIFAIKTRQKIKKIIPFWEKLTMNDFDYQYALLGAQKGLKTNKIIPIDNTLDLGFSGIEKGALQNFNLNIFNYAKKMIRAFLS